MLQRQPLQRHSLHKYIFALAIFTSIGITVGVGTIVLLHQQHIPAIAQLNENVREWWMPIALGAIGVILAIVLWLFNHPTRIAFAIACVLPFETVPLGQAIGYDDLDLITPILLLALIAVVGRSLFNFTWLRSGFELPIALFLLSALVAAALSFRPLFTVIRYAQYAKVFVMLAILYSVLRKADKRDIQITLWCYTGSAAFIYLYSLCMYVGFVTLDISSFTVVSGKGMVRLFATLRDPNIAAAYLIPLILLVLYWNFEPKQRTLSAVWPVILVVFLCSLLLTFSRSGFLAFSVAVMAWMFINKRWIVHRFSKVFLYGMLATCVLVVLLLLPLSRNILVDKTTMMLDRFLSNTHEAQASNVMHFKMAEWAWESFLEQPWGVGRKNLAYNIGPQKMSIFGRTEEELLQNIPVHNSWLEILANEGLGGFIAFVWIVGKVTIGNYRVLDSRYRWYWQGEARAIWAGFIGILVSMVFYTYDWMYFVWFLIIIQHVLSGHGRSELRQLSEHAHYSSAK